MTESLKPITVTIRPTEESLLRVDGVCRRMEIKEDEGNIRVIVTIEEGQIVFDGAIDGAPGA